MRKCKENNSTMEILRCLSKRQTKIMRVSNGRKNHLYASKMEFSMRVNGSETFGMV